MKRNLLIPAITLAMSTALLGACANKPTMDDGMADMKSQMSALKDGNTSSMSKAEEALALAKSAQFDAITAKKDAATALATANAAKAQSDETDAKIDQMFKKAMFK